MNALAEIIRSEAARAGAIPFACFMELALYHPIHGYYERTAPTVGRQGDFFTSVSVGSLFGELLAFQFAEWLAELGTRNAQRGQADAPLQIVEAGAHDGRLAADILGWLHASRPELFAILDYRIVEPSPRRRARQEETLRAFAGRVRWFAQLSELAVAPPSPGINGVLFANELLDAFPVHRFGWDGAARRWFEWGVRCDNDRFVWVRLPVPDEFPASSLGFRDSLAELETLNPELLAVLPDGFTTEIAPAATAWWRQAAASLRHGRLLTLDYGLTTEQFFTPSRAGGTLRAYHRHQAGADLLTQPGEQDLTAHVNFTALAAAGEAAGLRTEGRPSQAQFLTRIAEKTWPPDARFGEWTPARSRQFQTLTHPEHLGRPFQVLLQARERAKA